jgi:hypothetical protein
LCFSDFFLCCGNHYERNFSHKCVFARNFWHFARRGIRPLDSIFSTKLTEFVPFIFIIGQYCPTVKRILPDWLCLPNKLGGGDAAPSAPPPGTPMIISSMFGCSGKWLSCMYSYA